MKQVAIQIAIYVNIPDDTDLESLSVEGLRFDYLSTGIGKPKVYAEMPGFDTEDVTELEECFEF